MESQIGLQGEMLALQRVRRESGSPDSLAAYDKAHA
jgi:hypothetical protein